MVLQPLSVRDVMASRPRTVNQGTGILDAVDFLLEHDLSSVPVVDDSGRVVGMISEKDCLKLVAEGVDNDVPAGRVSQYMSRDVVTLPANMNIHYAAGRFLRVPYRRFPVIEDGELVGELSRRDVLRAVQVSLRVGRPAERASRVTPTGRRDTGGAFPSHRGLT